MLLIVIILSFLLLASVGINFWLILYTIPWKNSTIDHFVFKFREVFDKKLMELSDTERIFVLKAYNEACEWMSKRGRRRSNKPK